MKKYLKKVKSKDGKTAKVCAWCVQEVLRKGGL